MCGLSSATRAQQPLAEGKPYIVGRGSVTISSPFRLATALSPVRPIRLATPILLATPTYSVALSAHGSALDSSRRAEWHSGARRRIAAKKPNFERRLQAPQRCHRDSEHSTSLSLPRAVQRTAVGAQSGRKSRGGQRDWGGQPHWATWTERCGQPDWAAYSD